MKQSCHALYLYDFDPAFQLSRQSMATRDLPFDRDQYLPELLNAWPQRLHHFQKLLEKLIHVAGAQFGQEIQTEFHVHQ